MLVTVLLIPVKLLLKSVGAIVAAILCIIGVLFILMSKLAERLAAVLCGLFIISMIVMLIFGGATASSILICIGSSIALIVAVLIVGLIGTGLIELKNLLNRGLAEIEII